MASTKYKCIYACCIFLFIFTFIITGAIIFSSGCDKNIYCSPTSYKIVDFTTTYASITSSNNSVYYLNVVGTYLSKLMSINIKTNCILYVTSSSNYTSLKVYSYEAYPSKSVHEIYVGAHNATECLLSSGTEYYLTLGIALMSFSGFLFVIASMYVIFLIHNKYKQTRGSDRQSLMPPQYDDLYSHGVVTRESPPIYDS